MYSLLVAFYNEYSLIYMEIQMGSVAKSFTRKSFLIDEEMRKYLTIQDADDKLGQTLGTHSKQ
jgi:hypothetical protein